MGRYLRGELAKKADIHIETLRYYEDQGLLPRPARSESGYRLYSEETLARLTFIKNAKLCGFTLKEIKKALVQSERGLIGIDHFLAAIDQKIGSIQAEVDRKLQTLSELAALKAGIQAESKSAGLRETLRELHIHPKAK